MKFKEAESKKFVPIADESDADILSNLCWLDKELDRIANKEGTYMNPDYHYLGLEYDAYKKAIIERGMSEEDVNNYIKLMRI